MLQPQSKKINKRSKNPSKKYKCSQCEKSYASYPTLYLHTKQKHNGTSQDENQTHQIGRPKKVKTIYNCNLSYNTHSQKNTLMKSLLKMPR